MKIFLIASPEERARRRYNEFLEKKTEITYDEVLKSIKERNAKAAETKCIENPVKKTRYISVKMKIVDLAYVFLILIMIVGGILL